MRGTTVDSNALLDAAALHAELLESEAHTKALRAQRDAKIREAIKGDPEHDVPGVTMYAIAHRLEISEQSVQRIRDRGPA